MTTPTKPRPLTIKQQGFVRELPLANSATEAAIKAGYSPAVAAELASVNLRKPHVAAAIKAQNEAATSAAVASLIERKEKLSLVIRKPVPDDVPVQAIISASDQLNRMESVYIDRSEVKSASVVVLVVKGFGGEDDEKADVAAGRIRPSRRGGK